MYDAVVIGGGFYGTAIALYLAQRGFSKTLLIEREGELLSRASYSNQARIHKGYHYPRSFTTAFRSGINLPKFMQDYPAAVKTGYTILYPIARHNSKVTAKQFRHFCREIGAQLESATPPLRGLFEPKLIEDVFVAEEYVFDAAQLARDTAGELDKKGVELKLKSKVTRISRRDEASALTIEGPQGISEITARHVFNCSYSGLNQFNGDFPGVRTGLKHEITELALMQMPPALARLGVTVMDGPFFSALPFPARGLHTLSHVRYTPHTSWTDRRDQDPHMKLKTYAQETRVDRMVRDVARYMPAILDAKYIDSLFEVKTVLEKNEVDDGRPILFEKHAELPGCYSILGGKIDNIYDVLEKLDSEPLSCA